MEEDIKVEICRICFNLISDKNFFLIKGSLRDMLEVITTELNLDKTLYPVMCNKCLNSLQEIFIFKTNYFESEERIEANISGINNVKSDLKDMRNLYSKKPRRQAKKINLRMSRLCRTCSKTIYTKKYIDLSTDIDTKLSSTLSSCIPEMDLRLTKSPVICQTCYGFLQKMEIFKFLCKTNESKIEAFTKIMDIDSHQVNLHEVVQFSKNHSLLGGAITESNNHKHTVVKIEHDTEVTEYARKKKLTVQDCLECVLVKMEPSDEDHKTEERKINSRGSQSNRYSAPSNIQNRKKRIADKGEQKTMTYCSDCNFKTKYNYNLRRHLIIAHKRKDIKVNKKFYQCPHCTFSAKWNIDLTRHLLFHVKPEALKCTRCPYSTNQNSQLIKHILSHVNADNIDKYRFLQLTKKTN